MVWTLLPLLFLGDVWLCCPGCCGLQREQKLCPLSSAGLWGARWFYTFWWGFVVLFSPLQNESELFGRTIRVNLAKPMRIKEGSSRPGELGNRTSLGMLGALGIN